MHADSHRQLGKKKICYCLQPHYIMHWLDDTSCTLKWNFPNNCRCTYIYLISLAIKAKLLGLPQCQSNTNIWPQSPHENKEIFLSVIYELWISSICDCIVHKYSIWTDLRNLSSNSMHMSCICIWICSLAKPFNSFPAYGKNHITHLTRQSI